MGYVKVNILNSKLQENQRGFTLIEIAIVLVIIGLLLGGVLQGQQLIENSRVKSATNDFNGLSAGAFSYQDRYGRLPGDDPGAVAARGTSWAAVTAGDGDGSVDALAANTFDGAAGESDDFFQQLRAAGFIAGDPADTGSAALPQNPFGGLIGVTNESVLNGLLGLKVCMNNVAGSSAIALDTQLDDGAGTTGRLRAADNSTNTTPTTGATAGATYSEDGLYIVCYRI